MKILPAYSQVKIPKDLIFRLCQFVLCCAILTTTQNANAFERVEPPMPPTDRPIPVIIDSDAKNEIDDQYALALAILRPDRFDIEGFVGTTYRWDLSYAQYQQHIDNSYEEIKHILRLAGAEDKWPVYKGSVPMPAADQYYESPGVDFIIKRARAHTPEDPLWVIVLGAATNMASAYLKAPDIADKVIVFWHGRSNWPVKCKNFNALGDRHAARLLFSSPMQFILFDTGTQLTVPMEETERELRPYGELGKYLHDYRYTNSYFQRPDKGMFDLGDIAALVDPSVGTWQRDDCPAVLENMYYDFTNTNGRILRCRDINRNATFNLLYDAVQSTNGVFGGTSANNATQEQQLCNSETFYAASDAWTSNAYPLANIHDRGGSSSAHALSSDEQWVEYHFPELMDLAEFRIREDNSGNLELGSWRLSYFDGEQWVNSIESANSTTDRFQSFPLENIRTDRIRVYLQAPTDKQLEVYEIECYGSPATAINLISSETFSKADSTWDSSGTYTLERIFDHNENTESHAEAQSAGIEFRFNGFYNLELFRIKEDNGGNYSLSQYRLFIDVGEGWELALDWQNANAAGWHEQHLTDLTAQAIRVECKAPAGKKAEIYEIECFGKMSSFIPTPTNQKPLLSTQFITLRGSSNDPDGGSTTVSVNGEATTQTGADDNTWEIEVPVQEGSNMFEIQSTDDEGTETLQEVLIEVGSNTDISAS